MTNQIDIARQILLEPAELTDNQLLSTLNSVLGKAVDSADIYLQNTFFESWVLEDGEVKTGQHTIQRGFGVRVIAGEKSGFAYSEDLALPALNFAASTAKSIARQGGEGKTKINPNVKMKQYYPAIDPLQSLTTHEKINLLKQIDTSARQLDNRVIQVNASLTATHDTVFIINSNGLLTADIRPLVRCSVQVIVQENNNREAATVGGGGRTDYQYFLNEKGALYYAKEAVRQALVNLNAQPSPAGTMPVVLGPGWPGILLHEAVGHGLEGDFNRKGISAFSGRIGERVASPGVTVVDNGTLPNRRGSLTIDDEGTQTQNTVLIENGILKAYMQDQLNARLMGTSSTGNGRRESYAHLPMPRMTNTYMLAGPYHPNEIIASVDKGIYAVNFSGGQVDITSGKFVFSTSEAYLIEQGKITKPVKGITLIGNGPDVLTRVSMIGNDLQLDSGVGTCGKEGQSVPVGVGQPTLKIDALTVGGTGC